MMRRLQITLILSVPRSGSSWVGDVLSMATDVTYLREPHNQTYLATPGRHTLVRVEAAHPTPSYATVAERICRRNLNFPNTILRRIAPGNRAMSQQILIKEVNPLACEFFLRSLDPQVIYLIRHPAAIAASYRRLGWLTTPDSLMYAHLCEPTLRAFGRRLGYVHYEAWKWLSDHDRVRLVRYEDLCASPASEFRRLAAFAGLPSSAMRVREAVSRHCIDHDTFDHFGTFRRARTGAHKWRAELDGVAESQVRNGYLEYAPEEMRYD
jgi:hypothetical protein